MLKGVFPLVALSEAHGKAKRLTFLHPILIITPPRVQTLVVLTIYIIYVHRISCQLHRQ